MTPSLPGSHPTLSAPSTMNLPGAIPSSQKEPLDRVCIKRSKRAQDGDVPDPLGIKNHVEQNSLIFKGKAKFDKSKFAPQAANPCGGFREGPNAAEGQGKKKKASSNSWPTSWKGRKGWKSIAETCVLDLHVGNVAQ